MELLKEINGEVNKMKLGREPEEDNNSPEIMKNFGKDGMRYMPTLINDIIERIKILRGM